MSKENDNKNQQKSTNYDFSRYELKDIDKKVLSLKLENKQNIEIAKALKKTKETISRICNKPEFKKAYNELTSEIQKSHIESLLEARKEASEIYISLMRSSDTPVIVKARICEYLLRFDEYQLPEENSEDNGREFKGWNDNNS